MKLSLNKEIHSAVFISDLHLSHLNENQLFFKFLNHAPSITSDLFILGDLFDYWVGDDVSLYTNVIEGLQNLTTKINVYFIHGNRDFLTAKNFFKETNIKLLDDITEIILSDTKILLLHGDTLCTDDVDYQSFRKKVRSNSWQKIFLEKSAKERLEIASNLRKESYRMSLNKPENIMDVNLSSLNRLLEKYHSNIVIHGHTHRKNIHHHSFKNTQYTRYVLGDWSNLVGNYLLWEIKKDFKFYNFT
jgi:UDP-2,3-diacylglucosamine hydrolase